MEKIVDEANMERAWNNVRQNAGAPGPDGITVGEFRNAVSTSGIHLLSMMPRTWPNFSEANPRLPINRSFGYVEWISPDKDVSCSLHKLSICERA